VLVVVDVDVFDQYDVVDVVHAGFFVGHLLLLLSPLYPLLCLFLFQFLFLLYLLPLLPLPCLLDPCRPPCLPDSVANNIIINTNDKIIFNIFDLIISYSKKDIN